MSSSSPSKSVVKGSSKSLPLTGEGGAERRMRCSPKANQLSSGFTRSQQGVAPHSSGANYPSHTCHLCSAPDTYPQPQSAQLPFMDRLLVSADLTADEIPATGGHRRFVPCQGKAFGWASDIHIKVAQLGSLLLKSTTLPVRGKLLDTHQSCSQHDIICTLYSELCTLYSTFYILHSSFSILHSPLLITTF